MERFQDDQAGQPHPHGEVESRGSLRVFEGAGVIVDTHIGRLDLGPGGERLSSLGPNGIWPESKPST
jgi:hypothetical protein